jgi:hypothetical protein
LFLVLLQDRQEWSRCQVRFLASQEPKSVYSGRHSGRRYINFANATPDELEQLTQACDPASFGVKQEQVLDESYRKAGKMDSECFSSTLDLFHTDLIKIIRDYLLEGLESTTGIKAELYKLNTYGKCLIFVHPYLVLSCC